MNTAYKQTDLVVLGAGPGGYTAAFLAAKHGLTTTLIDTNSQLGGVCLQHGCIPSKALLHLAKLLLETRDAAAMGIQFGQPCIDLEQIRSWKKTVVKRLTDGLAAQCQRRGVTFIHGRGRLLDDHTLEIEQTTGGCERLHFTHGILASGSRPAGIPGLNLQHPSILNSTQALALETIPRTLLVVGGGSIGLELGTVYAALGSQVSLIELTDGLLPGADRDLLRPMVKRLTTLLSEIQTNTRITAVQEQDNVIQVTLQNGTTSTQKTFDRLLIATGRRANTEHLGLEAVGIYPEGGFVQVGPDMRTVVPNLLAIGDLVGGPLLAHKATHEARVAVATLLGKLGPKSKVLPYVTYTDPELAYAGLTETAARQQGIAVRAVRFPWAASGRAHTMERTEGLSKWIIDPKTERILGIGLVGPCAGELLAQGVLAIEHGLTIREISSVVHPHPTLSETLLEAAETFFGESVHYDTPKR